MFMVLSVITVLLLSHKHGAASNHQNEFAEPAHSFFVKAAQGSLAKLPCDITPFLPGDKVHIVIWFKESDNGKVSPIYTFDSRDNILLEQGKHWSDELGLGERARFRFQEEPAKLTIDSVLHKDAGVYQCRVDFKQSPTRNSKVNLTVIIPPGKLNILDEKGIQVNNYILGPYTEGSLINLTCIATGGLPVPKVTWWQENALLDDSYEVLSENRVQNILHMERLQRKHLHTVLTCQASNNDLIAPISTSVRLDLNLRPLTAKLVGENMPLSAGKSYQLKCEVRGSRPAPRISWWKGNTRITNGQESISGNGDVVMSTLTFIPTLEDDGKYITCNAKQPVIPDSTLESGWKLNIRHVPLANLELGSRASNKIREGSDVYFDCNIKSNPWVYKISWKHNGKMLYSNISEGVIISNQSLVLQGVKRNRAGFYTCIGSNQEGDGESNSIQLEIQFSPVCRARESVTYNVPLYETVPISCELEANPAAIEYIWLLNNTQNLNNLLSVDQATRIFFYKPKSKSDYGTLFCKGINLAGEQQEPCVFHLVYTDKPDPLSNCSLLNQTHHSLIAVCAHNLDSGLNQTFIAEVYNLRTHTLLKNFTHDTPLFTISGLTPGLQIEVNLYVANEKGRSETTRLNASIPSWEYPAEVLLPPENCSVTSQTRSHLRIKCQASMMQSRKSLTYLLQVYDANSRALVGTSTSRSPEAITVTALPRDYQDLLLFVRGVDENYVTSNATILYAPAVAKTASLIYRDSVPIKLHVTPALAITIGAVIGLVLIFSALLMVNRLCKNKKYEEKDDGGLSSPRTTYATVVDTQEEAHKKLSVEDEREPDIIPSEERFAGDSQKSILSRTYVRLQDADDVSPQPVNITGHSRYHINANETGLPRSGIIMQHNPMQCPIRSEHFPLYKPEKFTYIPKSLPKEVCTNSNGSSGVLEPLLVSRARIPMMLLPQQQLTATQL